MVGDLQGVAWFYSSGFEVNSFARALLPFRRCLATLLPALPSPFSGKYVVSIMVPLSFVSVTVPGGCRSQGCHGYPTRSAPVLEAPPSFQAPSPSSSIVDEFNITIQSSCEKFSGFFFSYIFFFASPSRRLFLMLPNLLALLLHFKETSLNMPHQQGLHSPAHPPLLCSG